MKSYPGSALLMQIILSVRFKFLLLLFKKTIFFYLFIGDKNLVNLFLARKNKYLLYLLLLEATQSTY